MIVPGPDNPAFRLIRGMMYVWIALLVLALDPRTEDPAAPVKYLASAVAAASMMLVWVVALRTGRAPYRGMNPPLWFLFAFFGALGLSALASEAPDRGLQALCPWMVFAAIGFVAYQTFPHTRHLRNLFRAIVACVALSSAYGLAQHFGWDPFPWADRNVEEYRALPASYGNPNLAGHALVIALVLCAGLLADAWQRKRWSVEFLAYLVPGALMFAHLGFTQMRGGLAALGMALVFVAASLGARRYTCNRARETLSALAVCALVFAVVTAGMLLLAPLLGLDSSLQLRLNGYAGAAALFLENPIFGVGPGNYAFHNIPQWSDFEALWYALENKRNFHAHNEWLEMAAECGIPGLAAFIGLFLFSVVTFFDNPWLSAEKHRGLYMAIPAAILTVAADACFGFNLHAPVSAGLFFLIVALRPASPFYSAPTRRMTRHATVPLCILTLGASWALWSDYGHERSYQRAQGAVAWEREQREGGTSMEVAGRATGLLEAVTETWPGDYRGWMLRGDFALEQGQTALAVDAYGQALVLHPHLPRLHVQRSRAQIRAAQENEANAVQALDSAEQHANIVRERCPELAEAWGMLGWSAYVRTTLPALKASDEDRRKAVEYFNQARDLGLADDARIDAAVGELYAGLEAWADSADAYQRYIAKLPGDLKRWMQWHEAATRADDAALVAHRQALLHLTAQFTSGEIEIAPGLVTWAGGKIAALATSPAQVAVAERALQDAVGADLSLTGLWSAWIGLAPEGTRAEVLARTLAAIPESRRSDISPVIVALNTAIAEPTPDSLAAAAQRLAHALATAPGTENFERASVHAPLLAMLGGALRDSGQPDAVVGPALQALGGARFETGDLQGAEEALRAAEAALPAGELAPAWYYHSRTLAALGQPEAALAMAKAALDAGGTVEYQWQLARCLVATGHVEAARFAYDSLLAGLPPDHPYRPLVDGEYRAIPAKESST